MRYLAMVFAFATTMFLTSLSLAKAALPSPPVPKQPLEGAKLASGLPATTRSPSSYGAAFPLIRRLAEKSVPFNHDKKVLARALVILATSESQGRLALPAITFNIVPASEQEGLKKRPFVSAWGVFQWNQLAWNDLRNRLGDTIPPHAWMVSAFEEVSYPVRVYSEIYNRIIKRGGLPHHAVYGVFLWQMGFSFYERYDVYAKKLGYGTSGYSDAMFHWFEVWDSSAKLHESLIQRHRKAFYLLSKMYPQCCLDLVQGNSI